MRQDILCVTAPRDPAPQWPEDYPEFRGIALPPRDADSVHDVHVGQYIPARRPMSIGE